jgi:acyl-CoA synthetase (AMP-forming)/AMP-acid ligase II
MGRIEVDGTLTVIGRMDDTVRTGSGELVNLGLITTVLVGATGVRDAVVVPIESSGGTVIGALAEVDGHVDAASLRAHLAAAVPTGFVPRVIETTTALPRLSDGRPDRLACIARLRAAARG